MASAHADRMLAGAGWKAEVEHGSLRSDHIEIVLQLIDRRIDMDRCDTRTDLIKGGQDIFQRCEAAFQFGEFAQGYMEHYEFLSRATRKRNAERP